MGPAGAADDHHSKTVSFQSGTQPLDNGVRDRGEEPSAGSRHNIQAYSYLTFSLIQTRVLENSAIGNLLLNG